MRSILLISGHKNITTLTSEGLRSWRSVSALKGSTGATGEREWLWNILVPLMRDRLIEKGVQVFITDAIYHADTYSRDYDLALALHYDNGGTDSRCIISNPSEQTSPPYIYPASQSAAKRFIQCWLDIYPAQTGITSRQDRITEGMTDYYVWDYIKEGTPCALIEHGNYSCPTDNDKMLNHPDLIADANINAIMKYLEPDVVEEDNRYWVYYKGAKLTPGYETNPKDTIDSLNGQVTALNRQLADKAAEVASLRDAIDKQDVFEKQLMAERDQARTERDDLKAKQQQELEALKAFLTAEWSAKLELSEKDKKATQAALEQATEELRQAFKKIDKLEQQLSYKLIQKVGKYFIGKFV